MKTFFFDWWRGSRQSLARKGLHVFGFCVMPCKDEREPTFEYGLVGQVELVQEFITIQNLGHNWWWANGIRVEYFPRIHHIAALLQSPRVHVKNEHATRSFTGRIIFMSMFNDISLGSKENKQECELRNQIVSIYAKRFSPGIWSFLGPGSEKKWYCTLERKPQGKWDWVAALMMLKFGESKHPVFRSTSPLSRGVLKSKGGGKLSIHFCADEGTIETVLRIIISVNQLSMYGAVSDLCDECKTCHVKTGRLVLAGQSNPL